VAGLLGKPYAPVLPPWGTGLAATALRRVGLRIPPEMLGQLRFGRGVDNRRFKAAGFRYQYTSRETVLRLGEHLRLDPVMRGVGEPYRYEREVEEFLRWSPHVKHAREKGGVALTRDQLAELRRLLDSFAETAGIAELTGAADADRVTAAERRAAAAEERATAAERAAAEAVERAERVAERLGERPARGRAPGGRAKRLAEQPSPDPQPEPRPGPPPEPRPEPKPPRSSDAPVEHYDDLAEADVIALLGSLEREDLQTLLDYERGHTNRVHVIEAIESALAGRGARV
jgi:hypothetical protein